MNKQLINAFRLELKKYSFYYRQRRYYKNRLILIEHEEEGIIGKDMSIERVQGSSDPIKKAERRLELIEEKEMIESVLEKINSRIDNIDNAINLMDNDIANSIRKIYIYRNSTLYKEANKLFMSKRSICRRIDEEISKLPPDVIEKIIL